MEERLAISVAEASIMAGLGRDAIYSAIRDGRLKAVKAGRRTLVRLVDLEAFVQALPPLHLQHG